MSTIRKNYRWFLPTLLALILVPFSSTIDLKITQSLYTYYGAFATDHPFYSFNYYMYIPAWIAVIAALCCLIYSYAVPSYTHWRKPCILIIAVFIIAPFLVVNALLKEHWGRPRPRQLELYGGHHQFHPFYVPNFEKSDDKLKSFPSGHVSMGFFFFAVAIAGKRLKNQPLHILGYVLAYGLGFSLSVSRIAVGGHFFTDAFFAGLIAWYTTITVEWFLFRHEGSQ